MKLNSAYTGRSARSMQAAFGPYVDHRLHPMRETKTERAAGVILAIVIGLLLALVAAYSLGVVTQ